MSKRSMLIAAIVAFAAVAIVAAVMIARQPSPRAGSNPAGSAGTTSSATSGTGSGTASGANAGAGSGTTQSGQGSATTKTGSGTTSSNGVAGNSGTGSNLEPLKAYPPLPDPGIPARAVTTPIPPGETIPPLTTAPEPTISGLKLGLIPDGSQYKITMRPYGIGPSVVFGSRVAIRVDSAQPVGSAPATSDIVNANILAVANTTAGGAVTKGGNYTAVLIFRSDGTKLLPILSNVAAAK